MANIKRVRCDWSGAGVVGPSISTFYFTSTSSGFSADLQTFFQAIKATLPDDVTVNVPNAGDTIDEANGTLQGVWTDSGGSTTTGTSTTGFAEGVGMRIKWLTGGFHNDRRVIGSTFIVPIQSASWLTSGIPDTGTVALLLASATALVSSSAGDMVIWSKPAKGGGTDGESNVVLAASVPRATSWLRTRRT